MLRPVVLAMALVFGAAQHAAWAQDPEDLPPILRTKGKTIRVKLVDAHSGAIISGFDVEVSSDNGKRCVRAPCPTNAKTWKGKSDARGYVAIPTGVVQADTRISTSVHFGDLIRYGESAADGTWVLELVPSKKLPEFVRELKLVDAQSNRPLIDTPVRVSSGEATTFDGKTNSLGYIFFYIFREIPGPGGWVDVSGEGWIDVGRDDIFVRAAGYKPLKAGMLRGKLRLEKQ
jgi:hypothetical protein